mgnify:CR=1 FL=1
MLKKIIKSLFKKHILLMIIEMLILSFNVYLLTKPSEILGKLIDLLYNVETNKQAILITVNSLIVTCILTLIVRVSWKMIDSKISRQVVKSLRDELFKKFLKSDISQLQSIKNGEVMSYFVTDIKEIQKSCLTWSIPYISQVFSTSNCID